MDFHYATTTTSTTYNIVTPISSKKTNIKRKKNTITTSFRFCILWQYSHNILPTKKLRLSGKPNNIHKGLANSFVIILLTYQKLGQGRIQQKIKTLLIHLVHPFSSFPLFTPTRNFAYKIIFQTANIQRDLCVEHDIL